MKYVGSYNFNGSSHDAHLKLCSTFVPAMVSIETPIDTWKYVCTSRSSFCLLHREKRATRIKGPNDFSYVRVHSNNAAIQKTNNKGISSWTAEGEDGYAGVQDEGKAMLMKTFSSDDERTDLC